MWMNSFLETATLLKMNFLLGIFKVLGIFCLKVSEDFFYHENSMLLQKTSLYICNNSKYVAHGLKIIQNYVNNKINN